MKYLIAPFILTLVLASSCKKDDVAEQNPTLNPSYLPLEIGNYWVYSEYMIDSLGNENLMARRDSMYVANDTLIGKNTYSVIRGSFFPHSLTNIPNSIVFIVRDSAGYMVEENGNILFTDQVTSDTLDQGIEINTSTNDTIFTWFQIMDQNNKTLTVPSGSFNTMDCQTHYTIYPNSPNPINQVNHRHISENVGIIIETYAYANQSAQGSYFEKRLVKYHVSK